MKRISLVIIVALILALISLQTTMAAEAIKVGHGHSISHSNHLCFEMFKSLVELKTDKYVVEIFPNSQLGSEAEMVEMVKLGTLQAVITARYESMGKEIYTATLPFVFKDYDHVNRVLKGPVGDYLASFAEDEGLKSMGWYHSGFRQITNNVRPIKSPADLKGLKMRTPPLENILQTISAFGANPTSIAYSEIYMALKAGVVDGQENPYENIISEKLYEVQKYCTNANYIYLPGLLCVGLDWWNNLPIEDQKIIADAAKVAISYNNYIVESTDAQYKKACIEKGMEIYELSDEERQFFINKAQPVYDFFVEEGISTQRLIELIQNS